MAGAPTTHFEVYRQQGGRWVFVSRFDRNERESAVAEAKEIEKRSAVKVVREVSWPETGQVEETIVYKSEGVIQPREPAPSRTQGGAEAAAAATPSARAKAPSLSRPSPPTELKLLGRMRSTGTQPWKKVSLVSLASLGCGVAAAAAIAQILPVAQSPDALESKRLMLLSTFALGATSSALFCGKFLFGWDLSLRTSTSAKTSAAAKPPRLKAAPAPEPALREAGADAELVTEESVAPAAKPDLAALAAEIIADAILDAPKPAAEKEAEIELAPETSVETNSTMFESSAVRFRRYVSEVITAIRQSHSSIDSYQMFGLDLALAGAVDMLGEHYGLSAQDRRDYLMGALDLLGVKTDTAKAFAERYEAYLAEPRYLPMIMAGRSSMDSMISGSGSVADEILAAFTAWGRPQRAQPETSHKIMTIMFTDIVGSTAMTQESGDAEAQLVVRRHNRIVRDAIAQFAGQEIKHTGDGIMASFASAGQAAEAAVTIQRAVADYNQRSAGQPLHLRIGLNSGEPIAEEDDLFGGTVQLAARICAFCEVDEIACSNVVRELSNNRSLTFESLGFQKMKGFAETVLVYRIVW